MLSESLCFLLKKAGVSRSGRLLTTITVSHLLLQTGFVASDLFMLHAFQSEFGHILVVTNAVSREFPLLFYQHI